VNKVGLSAMALALIALSLLPVQGGARVVSHAIHPQDISAPVKKWQQCSPSWCQTGWYSSPAVADLDGDGDVEVVNASCYVTVRDGATGEEVWRVASGHDRSEPDAGYVGRTWPGVVVADVDGDDELEIVTAHGGGYVSVYDRNGYFEPGWPQRPATRELRGLSVYDLDDDGAMEIIVTGAVVSEVNTWVYEHDGALRSGWPQLNGDGYAWGAFNDNSGIGDLDGDGMGEIVVPSDVHYICAYERDGAPISANSMYGEDKVWGEVGVHVDHEVDLRGYANCDNPPHPPLEPRPNFANSPAAIADVNGDGVLEVVVVGNNYDCRTRPYTDLYEMVYIFNADRSRWSGGDFDWTVVPPRAPDGSDAPICQDWRVIESNLPNPVVADLDGDGEKEILYSSYDGRVHAYWLDKTEHGSWPYAVYDGGVYRFASEPAVADLDDDGYAEVIFASWTQKGSGQVGKLHILDYQGEPVHEVSLPEDMGGHGWNGALAAPTLANIDDDADLELVLNVAHSGAVAYDLPGTANARVLWGTGRGNYQRTGSLLQGSLRSSWARVTPTQVGPGDALAYTVRLDNAGPTLPAARVTSTLSADVHYLDDLWASSGDYGEAGGVITWTGAVSTAVPVTITYGVSVSLQITRPTAIAHPVLIDDGRGNIEQLSAAAMANGRCIHLPLVLRR